MPLVYPEETATRQVKTLAHDILEACRWTCAPSDIDGRIAKWENELAEIGNQLRRAQPLYRRNPDYDGH